MRNNTWHIFYRWFRDRRKSILWWNVGFVAIVVLYAAFYPLIRDYLLGGSEGVVFASGSGMDLTSPLGYLWNTLYSHEFPWVLMAYGIALGTAAIASDESSGNLEYLLSKPVTRTQIALARYAGVFVHLLFMAFIGGLALAVSAPFFDLTTDTATSQGVTLSNIFNGTFSAFAVGLGYASIAYFIGTATGRKSHALGISTALAIGGYVFYGLSQSSGHLEFLAWASPWRWYIESQMFIEGLDWQVALPFILSLITVVAGWRIFLRRDLQKV